MAQYIATNIYSLNAQNNLAKTQTTLATSLQRLSSGMRINSAKDDAAGLGIATRMSAQINGLQQASRNANDGISLAQTAEGALAEVTNNLQRIRELAVQSANATNSTADRASIDQEVQQRLAEIDRVASQTSFNGLKVLDGTFGTATFQVGANVGETISVGLNTSTRISAIGKTADYVGGANVYNSALAVGQQGTGVTGTALNSGDLVLNTGTNTAITVGASAVGPAGAAAGQTNTSAYAKVAAINAAGVAGLTATADTTLQVAFTTVAATSTANDTYSLTINGQAIFTAATTSIDGNAMATAINANTSSTGVTAAWDGTKMTLNAADGRDIIISQSAGSAAGANEGFNGTNAGGSTNNTVNALLAFNTAAGATTAVTAVGSIHLTSTDAITVAGTTPAKAGFGGGAYAIGSAALSTADVKTVGNSNTMISRVDAALSTINTLRGTFGAIQNRFESTIANLSTTTENLTASRSRIQDADFAAETSNLTRAQILQQAGTAMLAQANQVPQGVLALLK